ncbi:hypothetical protein RRU01S_15_01090 [Agrobacterium rubi TR3 = NBRC 13261]|uniref:Uncharacterized protein n=1 Tax=Agrobacterium rubi TR3 = NBRC 13261 TaxID=1368415 RepID=A0A081CWY8_9HYPH|nr:hypothetical protein [Agrobacterium rubi]MBP1878151.1 hypothetical protein [Agrobacterium rubi]GAK71184.1 hypothetical protein RRU01S_15_01090 [Agrobacterium rubi TR3 = NBRC 13261]
MALFQADVARSVDFGPMTVGRVLRALDRVQRPFTAEDAKTVFCAAELQSLGMTVAAAAELLGEFSSELQFVLKTPANRCWIVSLVTAKGGHSRLTCHTMHHLEGLLDAHPFASVLPLHEIVSRATERFKRLEAAKEAA